MKTLTTNHSKPKQAVLPIFISDYLDICDPVLVFDRFMEEIDLEKYLNQIPAHVAGRIRYNPASMLKTVLFGFMTYGYISLRELEDNCKVNLRFMYLMEHKTPSYRTFGYFINEVLKPSVEELFSEAGALMNACGLHSLHHSAVVHEDLYRKIEKICDCFHPELIMPHSPLHYRHKDYVV